MTVESLDPFDYKICIIISFIIVIYMHVKSSKCNIVDP